MVNSPKEILLMKRSIERNKGNHKKLRALKSLSKLHRCCTHVIDERGSASYSLLQSSKFSFFQNRKQKISAFENESFGISWVSLTSNFPHVNLNNEILYYNEVGKKMPMVIVDDNYYEAIKKIMTNVFIMWWWLMLII